jgi:hypothetical protein
MADRLLGMDSQFGRPGKDVKVIEQFCRRCHQKMVANFMKDCEPRTVFVDVAGIKDPGLLGVDVLRVVPID